MQSFGLGCDGLGYHLGSPGGGETGESAVTVVVEELSSLFGSENRESHCQ